jgi:hypothetical protein
MNKLFFLHIPKTGGSFVRDFIHKNGLRTNLGRENENYEHTYLVKEFEQYQKDDKGNDAFFQPNYVNSRILKDINVFSIVRNPFDLLVSVYHYAGNNRENVGWGFVNEINNIKSFEEFVNLYCEDSDKLIYSEPFKKLLFFPIFEKDGSCGADYILFQENLNANLIELSEQIGVKNPKLGRGKQNASKRDSNYRNLYTPKMVDMVNEKCKVELDLFNYSFEGGNENSKIIKDTSNIKIDFDGVFKDLI